MSAFSESCRKHNGLATLTSISLTTPVFKKPSQRQKWLGDVLTLLEQSPIGSFQLYANGGVDVETSYAEIDYDSMKLLVDRHGPTLRRIGIQRLITPLKSLSYASLRCPNLQDVFVTLCDINRVRFSTDINEIHAESTVYACTIRMI